MAREVKEIGQEETIRDEEIFSDRDFARCIQFHSHTCLGLAIGFGTAITGMPAVPMPFRG